MKVQMRYASVKGKKVVHLILETLWMSNFSRQELALLYGVHSDTVTAWINGDQQPRDMERIRKIQQAEWWKLKSLMDDPYTN